MQHTYTITVETYENEISSISIRRSDLNNKVTYYEDYSELSLQELIDDYDKTTEHGDELEDN